MLKYKNITLTDYIFARLFDFKTIAYLFIKEFNNIAKHWRNLFLKKITLTELFEKIERDKYYRKLQIGNYNYKNLVVSAGFIKFTYKGKQLKFFYDSLRQLNNTMCMTGENFFDEQFKNLNVNKREIVDIGANIGDTAIYFALNGATLVYAYEPYPYSYLIAKKNIQENGLVNKIIIRNKGAGARGYVNIDEKFKNVAGSNIKNFDTGKSIEICSLSDILKECSLNRGVIKIDCEGHEYDLIMNATISDLRSFDYVMIEYHYGYINIINKLKDAGFFIKKTPPRYFFNNEVDNKKMYVGMIYAYRLPTKQRNSL